MPSGTYADFYTALGQNESGNNYSFVSSLGYLGRFQFGEEALQAIGFYNGDHTAAIDFIGGWTPHAGGFGAWDKSGFLASPAAQNAAADAWFAKIDADLDALGLRQYEGQWMSGGVQVTDSGLLAGAHLVGVWALKAYLESGGAVDTRDGYGTPVSEYVHRFGGYDTPFSASPPEPDPGGGGAGQALQSGRYGDVLVGGGGADTLNAGQGPDQLTGGGGADRFVFADLPWNAGFVADFQPGADQLDLSALFSAHGYRGADPVADHYVSFEADGAGGARVLFDPDGPAAGQAWSYLITTLRNVSPERLSASDLLGAGGGPGAPSAPPVTPPSGGPDQTLASSRYADVLAGGAGSDTLLAGRGPDQLTGGGGGDRFVFAETPWNAGVVTDFTPGLDTLDVSALFEAAGYWGADPQADGLLRLEDIGGATKVYVDIDAPDAGHWPYAITTLQGVAPWSLGSGDIVW